MLVKLKVMSRVGHW